MVNTPETALAITQELAADLVPIVSNEVIHAYETESELAHMWTPKTLRGTDTMVERVVGLAKPERIDWTERDKHAQAGAIGKVSYSLDYSGYVRHEEKNISALISDVNTLKELAIEHGKAIAILYDTVIFVAMIHGTRMSAMTAQGGSIDAAVDLDKVIEAGGVAAFDAVADESDVTEVVSKLRTMITWQKARRRFSKMGTMLAVSYGLYNVLLDNDKLVSKFYSPNNGDYSQGEVSMFMGVPIVPLQLFQHIQDLPGETATGSVIVADGLSVSTADAEIRAILFEPSAVVVLEAMRPTSTMFYEDMHKMNYIDTQFYFNAGVRRQDKLVGLYRQNAFLEYNESTEPDGIVGALSSGIINVTATAIV